MKKAFFLEFELNKPFTYIEDFINILTNSDIEVDIFNVSDAGKDKKSPLVPKIEACNFMILRKPLTFLSSESSRTHISDAVIKGNKNLLIIYSFSDIDSLEVLNNFLEPLNLRASSLMVYDEHENFESRRIVVFREANGCFEHREIFKGVDKVIIPQAHHIFITEPAKVMIRGNPTTRTVSTFDMPVAEVEGREIIVGAFNEKTSRVILMDSTLVNNKYIRQNTRFVKNVIKWISEAI